MIGTRDRRAIVVGLSVIGISVVLLRGVPAAHLASRRAHERFAQQRELLSRLELEVAEAGRLEDSGAAVKAKLVGLAPRLLSGSTDGDALAGLTAYLQSTTLRHRVRIARMERLDDSSSSGDLRRLAAVLELEGDSRGTFELLANLNREPITLEVSSLRILAPNPLSPDDVPEVLRTELTIAGWYLAAGSRR